MTKRIPVWLLVGSLCVLSGCAAVFDRTYTSQMDFKGSQEIALNDTTEVVKSYAALRRVVYNMINNHLETAELLISGYSGDVVSDIASICGSANTDTAYGAYCVEYASYDLTQIVSYYEVTIHITYKYTSEELETLSNAPNHDGFSDLIVQELASGKAHTVIKVNNGSGEADAVTKLIRQACRNHPLEISYVPEVAVKVYSGNTSQRIYEIDVVQNALQQANAERLQGVSIALNTAKRSINTPNDAWTAINAARYLSGNCALSDTGSTAYDALLTGQADSEGMATAYKALCEKLEIECQVVEGQQDKTPHYWNIICIDGAYYHVDVSELRELGESSALLLNDSEKLSSCWWDLTEYPTCEGTLSYQLVTGTGE